MQLKTHLHIADVVHARFEDDLNEFFFKLGSVLPDILPNMRFRPHSSKSTPYLQKKIGKLEIKENKRRFALSIRLGIIAHFLSDLSCKPHMDDYTGSAIDHRKYEVNLSMFHGKYHEDLLQSIIKTSALVARIVENRQLYRQTA
ncbi:MAG: zinc dependent phospholipase C family protein [Eubacteriales bacterium]